MATGNPSFGSVYVDVFFVKHDFSIFFHCHVWLRRDNIWVSYWGPRQWQGRPANIETASAKAPCCMQGQTKVRLYTHCRRCGIPWLSMWHDHSSWPEIVWGCMRSVYLQYMLHHGAKESKISRVAMTYSNSQTFPTLAIFWDFFLAQACYPQPVINHYSSSYWDHQW